MRPLRLEIEGFTSFREKCEIDFSQFDLFAITGQTGAGKTSILDAMTYALYGYTSRLSKAGKDLISQGANSMSVMLHFRAGSKEYRVLRNTKGQPRLELLEGNEWTAIAGKVRDLDTQIQQIVGLDFTGFTRTVILPQGRFDDFLRGKREDRDAVLKELLDIEIYDYMKQSANTKSSEAKLRAEERANSIEVAATPEALAEAKVVFQTIDSEVSALTKKHDALVKALPIAVGLAEKRSSLAKDTAAIVERTRNREGSENERVQTKGAIEEKSRQIETLARNLKETPYDADLHLRLKELLPQARRRNELGGDLRTLNQKRGFIEKEIAEAAPKLQEAEVQAQAEQGNLQSAAGERERAAAHFSAVQSKHGSTDAIKLIIENLKSAQEDAEGVPAIQREIGELEQQSGDLAEQIKSAESAKAAAEEARLGAEALYQKAADRDRAKALRHGLKPGEPCPVCEQTVHNVPGLPDSKALVEVNRAVEAAKNAVKDVDKRIGSLEKEARAIPVKIEFANKRIADSTTHLQGLLTKHSLTAADALAVLLSRRNDVLDAETRSREATVAHDAASGRERKAVDELHQLTHEQKIRDKDRTSADDRISHIQDELADLNGVLIGATEPEQMQEQIDSLEGARQQRAALESRKQTLETECLEQQSQFQQLEQRIMDIDRQITDLSTRVRATKKEIATAEKKLGGIALQPGHDEADQIQRLERSTHQSLIGEQQNRERSRLDVTRIEQQIDRNAQLKIEIDGLNSQSALYRDLGMLLNAGNFQQYLLRSVFRILAREGSEHLRRLSSNRYEFVFEGDEFMVRDQSNAGETRSVKTLSGGESFLASLSLALALAESIAQLSGDKGAVALESLFLDEGFSTLDAESLVKAADAIEMLQDGRRLIGIITHVQSLADQMPARIEIEKTPAGSRIRPRAVSAES
jgi:exonuclease SbcC